MTRRSLFTAALASLSALFVPKPKHKKKTTGLHDPNHWQNLFDPPMMAWHVNHCYVNACCLHYERHLTGPPLGYSHWISESHPLSAAEESWPIRKKI